MWTSVVSHYLNLSILVSSLLKNHINNYLIMVHITILNISYNNTGMREYRLVSAVIIFGDPLVNLQTTITLRTCSHSSWHQMCLSVPHYNDCVKSKFKKNIYFGWDNTHPAWLSKGPFFSFTGRLSNLLLPPLLGNISLYYKSYYSG